MKRWDFELMLAEAERESERDIRCYVCVISVQRTVFSKYQ